MTDDNKALPMGADVFQMLAAGGQQRAAARVTEQEARRGALYQDFAHRSGQGDLDRRNVLLAEALLEATLADADADFDEDRTHVRQVLQKFGFVEAGSTSNHGSARISAALRELTKFGDFIRETAKQYPAVQEKIGTRQTPDPMADLEDLVEFLAQPVSVVDHGAVNNAVQAERNRIGNSIGILGNQVTQEQIDRKVGELQRAANTPAPASASNREIADAVRRDRTEMLDTIGRNLSLLRLRGEDNTGYYTRITERIVLHKGIIDLLEGHTHQRLLEGETPEEYVTRVLAQSAPGLAWSAGQGQPDSDNSQLRWQPPQATGAQPRPANPGGGNGSGQTSPRPAPQRRGLGGYPAM